MHGSSYGTGYQACEAKSDNNRPTPRRYVGDRADINKENERQG